jgi:arsenate reductase (thioredoxin)
MIHILSLLMFTLASAQAPDVGQTHGPTVVFVCEHGVAKSVIAARHFNKLAIERGLAVRAVSRGVELEPAVPDRVRDGLRSEGVPLPSGFVPTRVRASDTKAAARVVTFDLQLPGDATTASAINWVGVPAVSDGYAAASAEIQARVEALIAELSARQR